MSTPVFAVVGHPNKGKSSLVATLARDDSVRIAPDAGTTRLARSFPMRVGDEVLYTLVDTPGFQRARHVLHWLREMAVREDSSAADRAALVARFVAEPAHAEMHADECELLRPIVEGAAILYVVDGSVPYGREYEPEMEILRWTGRPSMAIVNPIGGALHVEEWQSALSQYFRIVRVIDAVRSEFDERLDLLRAFGELREEWRAPLARAIDLLSRERIERRKRSARIAADSIADALHLAVEKRLDVDEDADAHRASLEEQYRGKLRKLESRARTDIEAVYDHRDLDARASDLELLASDLFSEDTWMVFGLRRRDLLAIGAVGGAAGGVGIDVAVGGASLFAGAAIGALLGAAAGWWTSDRLSRATIIDQPLGGRLLRCGPSTSPNLPFVLLGRARHHHAMVAKRTHAERGELLLDAPQERTAALEPMHRARLARLFHKLAGGDAAHRGDLATEIQALFGSDEERGSC